jgi:hypothetical protein
VRRRVGVVIGLKLDDPPADTVNKKRRADQIWRNKVNASGEKSLMELVQGQRYNGL